MSLLSGNTWNAFFMSPPCALLSLALPPAATRHEHVTLPCVLLVTCSTFLDGNWMMLQLPKSICGIVTTTGFPLSSTLTKYSCATSTSAKEASPLRV